MTSKQQIIKDAKDFPVLFGKDKNNKIKSWKIQVVNEGELSKIICEYGQLNGKKTIAERTIESGKNANKKNQTTHFEQAIAEATSKWKYKKEKDLYVTEQSELNNSNANDSTMSTSNILLPMLAQDFKLHSHKIKYPCYIQPKLDGYRAVFDGTKGIMYTRQGQQYNTIDTILNKLNEIVPKNMILDGELYSDELMFEELAVLRKKKLKEEDHIKLQKIKYHIYDIIDTTLSFKDRASILEELKRDLNVIPKVSFVETCIVENEFQLKEKHEEFVGRGFEGTMIRNINGKYIPKYRSYDLQKKKDFKDAEFEIVGFDKEQGDLIVWICKTKDNKKFSVQSKGNREERKELYKNAKNYIGKMLWVKYFELTHDGIPRFPKTLRDGVNSIRETID
jgi:DNA ligase 1